jgi:hypothetical protein
MRTKLGFGVGSIGESAIAIAFNTWNFLLQQRPRPLRHLVRIGRDARAGARRDLRSGRRLALRPIALAAGPAPPVPVRRADPARAVRVVHRLRDAPAAGVDLVPGAAPGARGRAHRRLPRAHDRDELQRGGRRFAGLRHGLALVQQGARQLHRARRLRRAGHQRRVAVRALDLSVRRRDARSHPDPAHVAAYDAVLVARAAARDARLLSQ